MATTPLSRQAQHWMSEYVNALGSSSAPSVSGKAAIQAVERACQTTGRQPWELFGDPAALAHNPALLQPWLPQQSPIHYRGHSASTFGWREVGELMTPILTMAFGYIACWPIAVTVRAYRLSFEWVTVPGLAIIVPLVMAALIAVSIMLPMVVRNPLAMTAIILVLALIAVATIVVSAMSEAAGPWVNVHPVLPGVFGLVLLFLGCYWAKRGFMPGPKGESSSWIGAFILLAVGLSLWVCFDPHLEHVPDNL